VHADDLLGVRRRPRDLGDGKGRRIGREHRAGTRGLRDLAEDLALQGEGFGHGLDDEVRPRDGRRERIRLVDPAEDRVAPLRRDLSFLHLAREGRADLLESRLDRALERVVQRDVEARAGRHLRDPASHRPRADDRNRAYVRHRPSPANGTG
jgi:hypothetical protein